MYVIILPSEKYKWFNEIAFPLKESIGCFDIIVDSFENIKNRYYDDTITYILLGCETFQSFPAKNYVVYQFEQLHAKTDPKYHNALKTYVCLMKGAKTVWEYSYINVHVLINLGITNIEYKPFGYSPCIEIVPNVLSKTSKDIDILWLGCTLGRRVPILNRLKETMTDYSLLFTDGVFSKSKADLLARSKIALNIHMEEPHKACLEVVRIVYLVANRCLVVSEYSSDAYTDDIFKSCVIFCKDIKNTCDYLLQNPDIIKSRVEYSYNWLKKHYQMSSIRL